MAARARLQLIGLDVRRRDAERGLEVAERLEIGDVTLQPEHACDGRARRSRSRRRVQALAGAVGGTSPCTRPLCPP
eukprot:3070643-Prymnesium_polylepis.1